MRYLTIVSVLCLSACATSAPSMIGNNQYLITSTNYTAVGTAGNRESNAIEQADAFCQRMGKVARVTNATRSGVIFVLPTSANVVFSCEDKKP